MTARVDVGLDMTVTPGVAVLVCVGGAVGE